MVEDEYLSTDPRSVPIGRIIARLADGQPDRDAAIVVGQRGDERSITWRELDQRANAAAGVLAAAGATDGTLIAVRLPMGLRHLVTTIAAWRLGCTVLPADPRSTPREFDALLKTARPALVVGERGTTGEKSPRTVTQEDIWSAGMSSRQPPETGIPRSAHATGGSTGRPRVILRIPDWVYPPDSLPSAGDRAVGLDAGQVQLTMLPLHHAGFTKLYHGLALGHTIVMLPHFVPAQVPALIERHRVNYFIIVPSMMRRLLEVPALLTADLSSVTTVHQSSAGAPVELKRAWMRVFAPETLYEGYSSQERIGALWIRGDEWLTHPGSVGRPVDCEVRIHLDDGAEAPAGVVGEVFLRSRFTRQPTYLGGGPALPGRDGFLSLGDAGYLDPDGYLHIVGRRTEMINVGGVKVYPAEVEEVLLTHPRVVDVAVAARPNEALGQAVHAVIVAADPADPPTPSELRRHCRGELSLTKVPISYEFRAEIPRSDAGKLRRTSLIGSATEAVTG